MLADWVWIHQGVGTAAVAWYNLPEAPPLQEPIDGDNWTKMGTKAGRTGLVYQQQRSIEELARHRVDYRQRRVSAEVRQLINRRCTNEACPFVQGQLSSRAQRMRAYG